MKAKFSVPPTAATPLGRTQAVILPLALAPCTALWICSFLLGRKWRSVVKGRGTSTVLSQSD